MSETDGLGPAVRATRARLGLVALVFALAALGWLYTVDAMSGMDNGPGTDIDSLGWFLGVWVVMMAAMMLPSVTPTVALYSSLIRGRSRIAPLAFMAGYLVVWGAVGLAAFWILDLGETYLGPELAWNRAGPWVAGSVILAAAVYELTPLKDTCLRKCRSPLGFLLGSWHDGLPGALRMGVKHGGWCAGCCGGLMVALFALGVMSIGWMALVAALIAAEKLVPWRRTAVYGTAALLAVLGVLVIAAPGAIPGFTIPHDGGSMGSMNTK